jgi:adenylylsulfate kinase
VTERSAEGVLLTGVYGSGKSSVAAEIAYLLEEQGAPFALLDLDYLSWTGPDTGGRAAELELLGHNLAAVTANYRRAGLEDLTISNDRPIANVAEDVLTFLGWP